MEAIRLLGVYTAGRFNVWELAGNAKASCRAHVMGAILGRRATQRESGVNALRAELFALFSDLRGDCLAARETDFIDRCRAMVNT